MRPLKRSTMPLVCGDLGGVRRWSMSSSVHSLSNSWFPVGARLRRPKRRSVNSLPLSVRIVRILRGQARSRSRRKRLAVDTTHTARSPRLDASRHLPFIQWTGGHRDTPIGVCPVPSRYCQGHCPAVVPSLSRCPVQQPMSFPLSDSAPLGFSLRTADNILPAAGLRSPCSLAPLGPAETLSF